jgi:hypothetical protein
MVKLTKKLKIPLHENDDRLPGFALMSGKNYRIPAIVDCHNTDINNRMYCNLTDGKKITMPRYYREKIYTK